jgi:hypothetical protein
MESIKTKIGEKQTGVIKVVVRMELKDILNKDMAFTAANWFISDLNIKKILTNGNVGHFEFEWTDCEEKNKNEYDMYGNLSMWGEFELHKIKFPMNKVAIVNTSGKLIFLDYISHIFYSENHA